MPELNQLQYGGGGLVHLRQLLGNVTTHKHGLKVHPEILNHQPVLENFSGVCQVLDPLLNVLLEGGIVPAENKTDLIA